MRGRLPKKLFWSLFKSSASFQLWQSTPSCFTSISTTFLNNILRKYFPRNLWAVRYMSQTASDCFDQNWAKSGPLLFVIIEILNVMERHGCKNFLSVLFSYAFYNYVERHIVQCIDVTGHRENKQIFLVQLLWKTPTGPPPLHNASSRGRPTEASWTWGTGDCLLISYVGLKSSIALCSSKNVMSCHVIHPNKYW